MCRGTLRESSRKRPSCISANKRHLAVNQRLKLAPGNRLRDALSKQFPNIRTDLFKISLETITYRSRNSFTVGSTGVTANPGKIPIKARLQRLHRLGVKPRHDVNIP